MAAEAGAAGGAGPEAAVPEAPRRRIERLDKDVVNRIAAGEVILRPASALKELLENALDAGATSVGVSVKEGGVKLLQVTDNGCGVAEADLPLLCERHATSKLRAYEDLRSVGTFGFRGEALASISYVSHLSVVTMPEDAPHALKAEYSDGALKGKPRPSAGVRGTQITAEDLFFNVPARRRALRPASEEYARLLEVAQRYAIFFAGRAISCRKATEARADLQTLAGASRMDNIRTVYGGATARELLPIEVSSDQSGCCGADGACAAEASEGEGEFSCEMYVSSANYQAKRTTFILFINSRLVECSAIKRAVEATYAAILPKHAKPFVFMALKLHPAAVDVNVHPTKKEVAFLGQELIIERVCRAVEEVVLSNNNTRTFAMHQSLLPGASAPDTAKTEKGGAAGGEDATTKQPTAGEKPAKKPYDPRKLVRVDARNPAGSLEAFVMTKPGAGKRANDDGLPGGAQAAAAEVQAQRAKRRRADEPAEPACDLTSVQELCAAVERRTHQGLLEVFQHHTWVGMADEVFGVLQHSTKLYLVNVQRLSSELFYQEFLRLFGRFTRSIELAEPMPARELIEGALDEAEACGEWTEADGPKDEIARLCAALLTSKAEMLEEYFAVRIDADGCVRSLPEIVPGHTPDMRKLPGYLLRLANEVDWEAEKECFESFARTTAEFYSVTPPRDPEVALGAADAGEGGAGAGAGGGDAQARPSSRPPDPSVAWALQHTLLPACRSRLRPPVCFATDGGVSIVAALDKLYRIFERC